MNEFLEKHQKKIVISLGIAVVVILVKGGVSRYNASKQVSEDDYVNQLLQEANSGVSGDSDSDSLLMQMQGELNKNYGKLPEGFIWDTDGSVLSLGDKSMTAEDVVYAYFRGLSTLDISTVERYSRDSSVVQTYSDYFDDKNKNTDYMDQFIRNMYKQCLLSLQIKGIENQAIFADNKQVFTVKADMLDLTDKDFWRVDQNEIYKNLYLYDSDESDSTKSDIYLYDYILNYYKSDLASLRSVTFDVTLQKYPDLDSGWLVSIDTDVNDACQYKDGKLVVSYIKELYRDVGRDLIKESLLE